MGVCRHTQILKSAKTQFRACGFKGSQRRISILEVPRANEVSVWLALANPKKEEKKYRLNKHIAGIRITFIWLTILFIFRCWFDRESITIGLFFPGDISKWRVQPQNQ